MMPWHDCPACPACGGRVGILRSMRGWYREEDTLTCPACGEQWSGTDEQIEQALIADTWWEAFDGCGMSEEAFAAANAAEPLVCRHSPQHMTRAACRRA